MAGAAAASSICSRLRRIACWAHISSACFCARTLGAFLAVAPCTRAKRARQTRIDLAAMIRRCSKRRRPQEARAQLERDLCIGFDQPARPAKGTLDGAIRPACAAHAHVYRSVHAPPRVVCSSFQAALYLSAPDRFAAVFRAAERRRCSALLSVGQQQLTISPLSHRGTAGRAILSVLECACTD